MKQNIHILVFFISLFQLAGFSQSEKAKHVLDSKTKLPVEYVYVYPDTKKNSFLSDKDGNVVFKPDLKIKAYTFYKIGYYEQVVLTADLIHLDTIFLIQKPYELNEITITSKPFEEVIKEKKFYVDDYMVLPNSDFLIITSIINIRGFQVCYYKRDVGVTCIKRIKNQYNERLFKDCFKNYHLVTMDHSWQFIFPTDSTFEFSDPYPRSVFDAKLAGITLKIDSQFIYKTPSPPQNFKSDYYSSPGFSPFLTYISKYRRKISDFYTVVCSKDIREMVQSELTDSKNTQKERNAIVNQSGNTKGYQQSDYSLHAATKFYFEKVLKPIYAPIFLKNDTVVLFNFQENKIIYLNKNGKTLGCVVLEEFSKYHDFEMFYDEVKQKFYIKITEQDKHFLARVNVYTGALDKIIPLQWPFPKKMQIINDKAYYLIREHKWDDTSYLIQQNL